MERKEDDHLEEWKAREREKARQELVRRLEWQHKQRVQKCIEDLHKTLYPKK